MANKDFGINDLLGSFLSQENSNLSVVTIGGRTLIVDNSSENLDMYGTFEVQGYKRKNSKNEWSTVEKHTRTNKMTAMKEAKRLASLEENGGDSAIPHIQNALGKMLSKKGILNNANK